MSNEWVPRTRLRMSRQIVTEIQTLEVEVRREELVITHETIPISTVYPLPGGRAPETPEPRIFVLRAEVPSVSLSILPVEKVTVTPVVVEGVRELTVALEAEHLQILESTGSHPPTSAHEKGPVS